MNEELVNLYNVIKKDTDNLIKELKIFQKKNSKEFYL
ncbi:DNA adenine methylase [bacterium]|nr:DNA adenine methylase [bacterium]